MLVDMDEMGKLLQEFASKSIKDKIEKGEALFDENGGIVFKDNPSIKFPKRTRPLPTT